MIERWINNWIVAILKDAIQQIELGKFSMTDEEAMMIFDALSFRRMNKGEAARFVHLGESQFDNEVRVGRLPRGRKLIRNDSKIYWSKRDLIMYLHKWRSNKT